MGLLAGISIAAGLDGQLSYMTTVVAMWFIAPVAAGLVAFSLIRYINSRKVKDVWQRVRTYKVLLIILAFTSAYTLGANTLGLIVATGGFNWATVSVAIVAVFVGSFFLGEGAIRRVGGILPHALLKRYSCVGSFNHPCGSGSASEYTVKQHTNYDFSGVGSRAQLQNQVPIA